MNFLAAVGEIRVLSGASLDITGSNGSTHIIGVRGEAIVDIDGGSLSFSSMTSGALTTCTVGGCFVEIDVANGGLLLAQFITASNDTIITLDGGTVETEQNFFQVNGDSMLRGSGSIVGDLDIRGDVFPGIDGIGEIDIVSDDMFDGNFLSRTGSSVEFEIGAADSFDTISLDGDLQYLGNLDVTFVDAYVPPLGTSFEIISVGGDIIWTPFSIDIAGLPSGVESETMVVEQNGAIVVQVPEAGASSAALTALLTSGVVAWLRRTRF